MDDLTTTWPLLLERGVRWLPGMLLLPTEDEGAYRVVSTHPGMRCVSDADGWSYWHGSGAPDLTDPATLGCLLAEVRRLSGDPLATTAAVMAWDHEPTQWHVFAWQDGTWARVGASRPTEGEALISALLHITTPEATP